MELPNHISHDLLKRFVHSLMTRKLICVAVSGAHASGYATEDTPLELKGLHVEPTANLVGLTTPPKAFNWVGEFEGLLIDYSSAEIGQASHLLLRGDGSILERILSPMQIFGGEDLRKLVQVAHTAICRRFFDHYRNFSKGVLKEFEGQPARTVRQALNAYRVGLTGVHLMRAGEVDLDLLALAKKYKLFKLDELVRIYQEGRARTLDDTSPWINRMAKLHGLLDAAYEGSSLPVDPENPADVEEYLLDMRRRFFDAHTVQM